MSKNDVDKAVEAINEYFKFKIDFYENQKSDLRDDNDLEGVEEAEGYINLFKNDWQEVISLVREKTGYDVHHEPKASQNKPDEFMEMLKEKVMNGNEETEQEVNSQENNNSVKKSYIETLQEQMNERKRQRELEREELRKERMRIREMKWEEKKKNKRTPKQTIFLTGVSAASAFAIGRKIGKSVM